jgi:hypothetical protein
MKVKTVLGLVILLAAAGGLVYALSSPAPAAHAVSGSVAVPAAHAVSGSVAVPAAHAVSGSDSVPAADPLAPLTLTAGKDALVVYYFHGNSRCKTCLKLEAQAKKAVENNFSAELADGRVKWAEVDYDDPAHAHFKKEFQLSFSTVMLASVQGGKVSTRTCEKTWELVYDEFQFETYLVEEIRAVLGTPGGGA